MLYLHHKIFTKMKHILLFVIAAILSVASSVSAYADGPKRLDPPDYDNPVGRPQKPAYSPLYYIMAGEEVVVYCDYAAEGEVTITDGTGFVVETQSGELSTGLSMQLPEGEEGTRVLTVLMNGKLYRAYL